jgi:hypothetical protein
VRQRGGVHLAQVQFHVLHVGRTCTCTHAGKISVRSPGETPLAPARAREHSAGSGRTSRLTTSEFTLLRTDGGGPAGGAAQPQGHAGATLMEFALPNSSSAHEAPRYTPEDYMCMRQPHCAPMCAWLRTVEVDVHPPERGRWHLPWGAGVGARHGCLLVDPCHAKPVDTKFA